VLIVVRPNFASAQTLLTIARVGTFTDAAKTLNTTQSAISARMRELERSLGYPLFVRHGRRLQLTIQAKQLIDQIQPLIEALEAAFHEAEATDSPRGTVHIGLAEVATEWLAQRLPGLHRELPGLRFELRVEISSVLQEELHKGNLDLAILAISTAKAALTYQSLGRSSFGWVCATSLLSGAGGAPRTFEDLLQQELLWIASQNSGFHDNAREELARWGAAMNHLCTTDKGLLEFAIAGAGVVLIPDAMSTPHVEAGRLSRLADALQTHDLELFVATNRNHRQPAIRRLEEVLLRSIERAPS
jgi:DNA-binding transcriptional LysR family regulator